MAAKAHEFSGVGSLHLSTIPLETLNESSRTDDPSALQNDIERINDGPRQRLFPPEVAQAPGGHRKAHILHRTSYYGAAVLVFGTVALLGVFGFHLFFWIQASRAGNNEATGALWKSIVDAEWTTRVVTISTTVIRVIVSAQAGFAMAMIAALILESSGSNPQGLPALSVFRATGPQPWSLLFFLRFTHVTSSVYSVLVLLIFILAAISQFTSTILISDFSGTNITKTYEPIPVLYDMIDQRNTINFWGAAPLAYWRFAEKTEPPVVGDGFVDTGPSLRAMIPWADEGHRRKLRFYDGPAVVLDARSFCIRPNLSDITFGVPGRPREIQYIQGNITFGSDYPVLQKVSEKGYDYPYTTEFGCMLGITSHHAFGSRGTSSICELLRTPLYLPAESLFRVMYIDPYIIIKSHGRGIESDGVVWNELVLGHRGPWKTLSAPDGRQIFSISVCWAQTSQVGVNVTMRGTSLRDEPTISWLPSPLPSALSDDGNMSTRAVREHFGVTNQSLSLPERGIMSLDLQISERTVPTVLSLDLGDGSTP